MKKKVQILSSLLAFLFLSTHLLGQKKLTEATISYDIVINTNNKSPQAADLLDGATSIIYLKGNSSSFRNDQFLGTQSTIIDGKTGNVTDIERLW